MKTKIITAAAMLLAVAGYVWASDKPKPNYKVTRMSVQDVGVSCVNGQMPDVKRIGHTIVIGCDAQ